MKDNIFIQLFNRLDAKVKFPNLKRGEVGIQVGFDMSSRNLTTDALKMHYRVSKKGKVIAVDPDPRNHALVKKVIERKALNNFTLIQKGTYSQSKTSTLYMSQRQSHNRVKSILADAPEKTINSVDVELETLDNMVKGLNVDYAKIRHINITNNGAEYHTLLGMETIFDKCENLNLTITSGRPGKLGEINGEKDYRVIMDFLQERGFACKFIRMNTSFWWGVVVHLIIKREWIFNKQRFGCILAARGNRKLRFFQSFS